MQYKVGDKVRLKSMKELEREYNKTDLLRFNHETDLDLIPEMISKLGTIVTITQVCSNNIFIEESGWSWRNALIKGYSTHVTSSHNTKRRVPLSMEV